MMMIPVLLGLGAGMANAAAVVRSSPCDFQVRGAGQGHEGPLGQLDGGQVRFGNLTPTRFRIQDGKVWDGAGRGCWWTPPTGVLQCDQGQAPAGGFAIACDGQLSFNGQTTFYQCETGDGGQWNVYSQPDQGKGCGAVTLRADGCRAACPAPPAATTPCPAPPAAPSPAPPPAPGQCPADLNGPYEFPHLILPVDRSTPNTAPATSFFGVVNPSVSSLFTFDIPPSDAGKTCTLLFLFPAQSQLETSSYVVSGDGRLAFSRLGSPAAQGTTWLGRPGKAADYGTTVVAPGNSYTIASFPCPAGQAISFEVGTPGSTNLRYFQDFNPSPIGLYIRKC